MMSEKYEGQQSFHQSNTNWE